MTARTRGIALIIVSSLLVLLAVAVASLLSLASGLRQRSAVNIDRETARLLARSGAAYAYSRLTNPFARAEAADDWAYRDSPDIPLERALNLSYARGEPYRDIYPALGPAGSPGDGKYEPGLDTFADLNANGRFDSWSGRLRGKHGLADATFALRIAGEDAKIDINGGTLSAADTDHWKGNGADCNDWLSERERQGWDSDALVWSGDIRHGIPAILNMHSSEVVNLTGEIIYDTEQGTPLDPTGRNSPPRPYTPVMKVGDALLQGRPPGGYRTLEEAERRAVGFPAAGGWISGADWRKVLPYLSTRHARQGRVLGKRDDYSYLVDRVQAVDVNTADRFLLQALFLRYVLWLQGIPGSADYMLDREDTGRIADFLVRNRPFHSRYDLFRKLMAARETLCPPRPSTDPDRDYKLVSFIAEMAEGASGSTCTNPRTPWLSDFPFGSWWSYDIGSVRFSNFLLGRCARWSRTIPYNGVSVWAPKGQGGGVDALLYSQLLPLSLDMGKGPSVFAIESRGSVGTAGARRAASTLNIPSVALDGVLEATSQDDFENHWERIDEWLPGSSPIGRRVTLGIAERRWLGDGIELRGRAGKVRVQTWPGYPLDSFPPPGLAGELLVRMEYLPREHFGHVALMPYAGRLYGGEFLYMPCWEKGGENGQPLRDPSHPLQSVAENFANLIPTPSSTGGGMVFPDSPHYQDITLKQWSAASSRTLLARRPTTIPMGTAHQWTFKDFPWIDSNGAFQGGTFDYWGMVVSMTLYHNVSPYDDTMPPYLSSAISSTDSSTVVTVTGHTNQVSSAKDHPTITYKSVGSYAPFTPHRVTLVMGSTVQGNVDGTPDPGLFGDFETDAPNPNRKFTFVMESAGVDFTGSRSPWDLGGGVRAFAEHWLPDKVRASALQDPYFWTSEAHPDVSGIPNYTSPLYVFPAPARLSSASWDGFVPAKIRDANPETPPLRVELLMYADEWAVPGTEQVLPLPAEGWRTGGESVDLEKEWGKSHPGKRTPRIRAFKYRVWFDSSAMGGVGNETPVFNSIRVGYRSKGGFLSVSEE